MWKMVKNCTPVFVCCVPHKLNRLTVSKYQLSRNNLRDHSLVKSKLLLAFSLIVLHVLWCVGEGGAVLRGGVFWSVWSDMAQDHHDRTVRVHPLRHTEVVDAVVGNDVCQVVLRREQTVSIRPSLSDRKSRCQSRQHCVESVSWCESKKIPKHYYV